MWKSELSSKSANQSRLCDIFFAHCLAVVMTGYAGQLRAGRDSWSGTSTPV